MDLWDTTPRLAFMSAEKESGKTRALEVLSLLVLQPILSFSATPAVMIRLVAEGGCTVLYDEVDALFGSSRREDGSADLVAFMNSGYRRSAKAYRCGGSGRNIEAQAFDSFAPIALAGLRDLPDTLASRSIMIRMQRRALGETVESFRQRYAEDEARPIREAVIKWCEKLPGKINRKPELPDGVQDRAADICEPLIAIAEAAGTDWPVRARAAAVYFTRSNAQDEAMTAGVQLLAHIKEAFGSEEKLWSVTIIERLCRREESPWADIRGKPLDKRGLAKRLHPYGIKSKDVWIEQKTLKGYTREDFHEAWQRYLPRQTPERNEGDEREEIDKKDKNLADIADLADRVENSDDVEERAAILEFDGGLTRVNTEAQAAAEFDGWNDMRDHLRRWNGNPGKPWTKPSILSEERTDLTGLSLDEGEAA